MKRVDLRHLKDNFYDKMLEILKSLQNEEVVIFLFKIGDFSHIQKVADFVYENIMIQTNIIHSAYKNNAKKSNSSLFKTNF